MFEPAYVKILQEGKLSKKVAAAKAMLEDCQVCPRNCRVNRLEGQLGFCEVGSRAVLYSAHPHFGEEEPLVGSGGSGTIFFSSCNLKCLFCQNYEISQLMEGREVSAEELVGWMISLQKTGCHNINFVTPSHVTPMILEAVLLASNEGLRVPLVYNTGGYDSVETLRLLDGVVDIYMPDLKFMDSRISKELMNAEDYPLIVRNAILEMHRQVGDLQINEDGIATRGLLVRHLVMPDGLSGTREAMRFLAREVSTDTYVNIMDQYRPCGRAVERSDINRSVSRSEYLNAIEAAIEEGIIRLDRRVSYRMRIF